MLGFLDASAFFIFLLIAFVVHFRLKSAFIEVHVL